MEGRLGRFIERFRSKGNKGIQTPDAQTPDAQTPDFQGLIWGKRILVSEINDPQIVEDLFQREPVLGQRTLPFDGIGDMEIYRTRTVKDILESKFSKPSQEEISLERQRLREFTGANS